MNVGSVGQVVGGSVSKSLVVVGFNKTTLKKIQRTVSMSTLQTFNTLKSRNQLSISSVT